MAGVPDVVRRKKAFELYVQYKNMSKVSKELKIPTQTIHKWKTEENWDIKINQLRSKLQSQLDINQKAQDDINVQKDLAKLNALDLLDQKVAEAITSGQVQIRTWKDIISTMEFTTKERRLILGEPTHRGDDAVDVSFTKEEDLDKHIEELKRFFNEPEPTTN